GDATSSGRSGRTGGGRGSGGPPAGGRGPAGGWARGADDEGVELVTIGALISRMQGLAGELRRSAPGPRRPPGRGGRSPAAGSSAVGPGAGARTGVPVPGRTGRAALS